MTTTTHFGACGVHGNAADVQEINRRKVAWINDQLPDAHWAELDGDGLTLTITSQVETVDRIRELVARMPPLHELR